MVEQKESTQIIHSSNCECFHKSISISNLQFEDTSCWEKAHTVGALLHAWKERMWESLLKTEISQKKREFIEDRDLTGHPAVAEVFEHNDGLAHPEEELGLVFWKMCADHSNSGQVGRLTNKLVKWKQGKLMRSIGANYSLQCYIVFKITYQLRARAVWPLSTEIGPDFVCIFFTISYFRLCNLCIFVFSHSKAWGAVIGVTGLLLPLLVSPPSSSLMNLSTTWAISSYLVCEEFIRHMTFTTK